MSLTIPNAVVSEKLEYGRISLLIPTFYQGRADEVVSTCLKKHGGFCKVTLAPPFKPRTFGPGSQSAHLHGHLQQLAVHFGYTLGEMKEIMKHDVPEWPWVKVMARRAWIRPESEANVSTVVESKAIEWTHLIAAEEGITLQEGKE